MTERNNANYTPSRSLAENSPFAAINIYQHRRKLAKINLQMAPKGA